LAILKFGIYLEFGQLELGICSLAAPGFSDFFSNH